LHQHARKHTGLLSNVKHSPTIWIPSKTLKKRDKEKYSNYMVAIPKSLLCKDDVTPVSIFENDKLATGPRTEELRKYQLFLNHLEKTHDPVFEDINWKIKNILKHQEEKGKLYFLVKFYNGDKQWLNMDDLRLHDPMKVIKYGDKSKLNNHPSFKWTELVMPSKSKF